MREDHTGEGSAVNAIVAVDLAQPGASPGRILAGGHDFFSSPRLSPDGRRLAWLAWDHPNMPWNGTSLYLAELADDGAIVGTPLVVAGGPAESIFQPEWSPDGADLVFVSDRSDWWNLYRFTLATGAVRPIAPMAAEFGQPQWNFDMATYAFVGPGRIVCTYAEAGLGHLAALDLATGALTRLDVPFTQFASVRAHGDRAAFIAGAPSHPSSVIVLDLASGDYQTLRKATDVLDRADPPIGDYVTQVEAIAFPTTGDRTAFGLFYRPHNPDYAAPADEKPPLLVKCHGGPTSAASSTLEPRNPVLDEPRHRGARCQLWRQHRFRPQLS